MKIINYRSKDHVRIGCVIGNYVIDLNRAYAAMLEAQGLAKANEIADAVVPANSLSFLEGGEHTFLEASKAVQSIQKNELTPDQSKVFHEREVKKEAPILNSKKIICVGHNYREHILEMKREIPKYPVIFAKFANTIIGPEDNVPLPSITEQLDYEAELAFVIGKKAKDVAKEDALDYVAGYTIVNDITARDLQRRTIQWLQGKTLDGSLPMGPWLVTKDEIPNPHQLEITLSVNGEERQRSNTKNLVFSIQDLVVFLSGIMTLEPGDVVCTGTPGGVGVAREPQLFLQDGDVVRIELEKVGTLENRVKTVRSMAGVRGK
ncbi:fumarylacetoacetate hydrolase family protein [Halalkalibacterium halodurans]|uniref:2-hydroxyhepta-2,4-diene-1,7-dioate isomerase n=1 Tax=Halalkalibacterium halodurans (strain ATCC BAA-125 / DSM 18197 / FERM 7344 / JCM 9153 / C-125) TaxID=272558 RepID=Q9KBC8_HALH5|nr:fumarylacetoacetate hydrolase family protein [Halalkalibacterium halodurans]MED4123966.1 fumarylacetoacetate hydrolase family protein [Halalkalibacterium halodurans]BAB05719.1 2-hydroxyhepta-2,4-diene-1,7-dioate isomerase [Halalkalibacterium halodurans C-125]